MRLLNLIVAAALVLAAGYVYRIKFDSAVQAERVAKIRAEIVRERDTIASLRAQWAQLDNPARIQALAQRHLALKPLDPLQVDTLDRLPERPADLSPPEASEPVGAMIETVPSDATTGSIPPRTR
jgi:hypothetical protein